MRLDPGSHDNWRCVSPPHRSPSYIAVIDQSGAIISGKLSNTDQALKALVEAKKNVIEKQRVLAEEVGSEQSSGVRL